MKTSLPSASYLPTAVLLTLSAAALLLAPVAVAGTYTVTRLLDNTTPIPDRPGQTFGAAISTVGFDGSTIVFFSGDGSTTNGALWSLQAPGSARPLRLADGTTTAPGNTGPFSPPYSGESFGLGVEDVRNGFVVFNASSPQGYGYYSIPEGGGAVSTLFNAASSQPNLHGNSYETLGGARIAGNQVFFSVDLDLAPQQAGIYSTPLTSGAYTLFGGTSTPITGDDQGTLYPGSDGGGSPPAFNTTTIAFEPKLNYRNISQYTAIYTAPIGGLTLDSTSGFVNNATSVVNGTTLVPGDAQGRSFDGQDLRVLELEESGAVVFYGQASNTDFNSGGIYLAFNGIVSALVTSASSLPGDGGHFNDIEFGTQVAKSGLVAFSSDYTRADGTDVQGIYTVRVADGAISKVTEEGDAALGGSSLSNVSYGLNDSGQVAFEGNYLANPQDTAYSYALFLGTPGGGGPTTRSLILSTHMGGDTGTVTLTLTAAPGSAALLPGASFKLSAAGQPDIPGTGVSLNPAGTAYTVTFDLTGQADAVYDLVLTNPDGSTVTQAGTFTVQAAAGPILYGEVIGRAQLRAGVSSVYNVLVGNRGDVDALMVPVFIQVPTPFATSLPSPLAAFPTAASADPSFDYSQIGANYPDANGGEQIVALLLPRVAAGTLRAIPIVFNVPDVSQYAHNHFTVGGAIGEPLLTSLNPADNSSTSLQPPDDEEESKASKIDPGSLAKTCVFNIFNTVIDCGGAIFPPVELAKCSYKLLGTTALGIYANVSSDNYAYDTIALSYYGAEASFFITLTQCAVGITPGFGTILNVAQCGVDAYQLTENCLNPLIQIGIETIVSGDPNDLVGSQGDGSAAHYLTGAQPLRYSVYFENESTASAPAQTVTVTNPLDPNLDLTTFSLGPIGFGTTVLNPPAGSVAYTTTVDLRPTTNLLVRVSANMNAASRTLTYSLQSLDPATGQPTTDPNAGFLPPDTNPPAGDGYAIFYCRPNAGLTTGTAINDQASIVFDANAAIPTPVWTNTIDNDAPASTLAALPATKTKAKFKLKVSGTDNGSGVASYNIYAAEDQGEFEQVVQNAAGPKITYVGVAGHKYKFFSQAVDHAGNLEPLKTKAETKTTIEGCDLIGSWEAVTEKSKPSGADALKGTFTVTNQGAKLATPAGSVVRFYLCNSATFDGSQQVIGRDAAFGVLGPNASVNVSLQGAKVANPAAASGKYVIAVIDPDNLVPEADETNNQVSYGPLP